MYSILEVKHLTKEYPTLKLDDVSFSVPKGTIMGLIGENGAGKSTVIKAMLDLIKKDAGQVTFWGQELSSNPKQLKEDIGVVFDSINFHGALTPTEIGNICNTAYRQWNGDAYRNFLSKFNLPMDKKLKTFSNGMKMKLNISIALSHRAKLLILDEPTNGLDPVMRDVILELLLDFVQDEEHSILISSHITTDLEKIADYILFLHEGKLEFCKPKDELRYDYGILRCGTAAFEALDKTKGDILAYRKTDLQWDVLVSNKAKAKKNYPNVIVDDATIDDILLLYIKGEHVS